MNKPPQLSEEVLKQLREIFYGEDFAMSGIGRLWEEVKKRKINISFGDLKKGFYDLQEVVQIFAPEKKPVRHSYSIEAGQVGERVYFDTMFFPRNKILVVNAFDLASRYGWSKPYRVQTKPDETRTSVTASKTTAFLEDVLEDLYKKGYHVANIVSDSGSEYLSTFHKELVDRGMNHIFTVAGDHRQTAPIDRYTKTIRTMAEKWNAVFKEDLYKVIPKLVKTYNNMKHSKIGVRPADAISSINTIIRKENDNETIDKPLIAVGDTVRVYVRTDKNPRKKIRPNWSTEMYKVSGYSNSQKLFTLNNGKKYREYMILKVSHPEHVQKYHVNRLVPAPRSRESSKPKEIYPEQIDRPKRQAKQKISEDFEYDLEEL